VGRYADKEGNEVTQMYGRDTKTPSDLKSMAYNRGCPLNFGPPEAVMFGQAGHKIIQKYKDDSSTKYVSGRLEMMQFEDYDPDKPIGCYITKPCPGVQGSGIGAELIRTQCSGGLHMMCDQTEKGKVAMAGECTLNGAGLCRRMPGDFNACMARKKRECEKKNEVAAAPAAPPPTDAQKKTEQCVVDTRAACPRQRGQGPDKRCLDGARKKCADKFKLGPSVAALQAYDP
jgi:hypothetical protein